jgi:hypothetical protein
MLGEEVLNTPANTHLWRTLTAKLPKASDDVLVFMTKAESSVRDFTMHFPDEVAPAKAVLFQAQAQPSIQEQVTMQVNACLAQYESKSPRAGSPPPRPAPPTEKTRDFSLVLHSLIILQQEFGPIAGDKHCLLCGKEHLVGHCVTSRYKNVCRAWILGNCSRESCGYEHRFGASYPTLLQQQKREALTKTYK